MTNVWAESPSLSYFLSAILFPIKLETRIVSSKYNFGVMFASLIAKIALLAHKPPTGFGSYPPQFWTSLYVVRPQERVLHLNAHSFSAAVFVAAKDKNAAVDIPVFGYICLLLLLLLLVLAIPGLLSPAEILP